VLREYIWLDGRPLAVIEGGQTYWLHWDHIGRPVLATDATGMVVWAARYLPCRAASTRQRRHRDTATGHLRFPRGNRSPSRASDSDPPRESSWPLGCRSAKISAWSLAVGHALDNSTPI
jgi:hypothetical protein